MSAGHGVFLSGAKTGGLPGISGIATSSSACRKMLGLYSASLAFAPTMMAPLRAVRSSSPMMAVTDMPGISTETGSESPKEGNLAFKPSLPLY